MPAINIALALKALDKEIDLLFIGRKDGMEKAIVNRFNFSIREIEVAGLKRNPIGLIKFIWKWNKSLSQASAIIKEFEPQAIVGTGGYVSAPVVRMAHKMGITVFMQEQNSLPGLATRTLSRMAENIFTAYAGARYLPAEKCRLTGNPVRPDLLDADREAALNEFGLDSGKKTILVLGGSSGARGINNAILEIVKAGMIPSDWQLLWQIGQKDFSEIASSIPDRFSGKYLPFIHNMPGAYSVADLIISRAGAMALAEIAVWGLPSILIPYPHATGDHQMLNANEFAFGGAAIVIAEQDISEKLLSTLIELTRNINKRSEMAEASRSLAKPDAAMIIAKTVLDRINEIQKN